MKYKQQIVNNNLKATRKALGLRQKDVAKILGFSQPDRISHWEKGQAIPSIINLFRLSGIYEVAPHELYSDLLDTVSVDTAKVQKSLKGEEL